MIHTLRSHARAGLERSLRGAVNRGLLPEGWRYRWIEKRSLPEHLAKEAHASDVVVETIHPEQTFANPLPQNVDRREALPDDAGWWGYSMRDVPQRTSAATRLVTLPNARVLPFIDPERGYFRPAIVTRDKCALELREISFRPMHRRLLATAGPAVQLERATWILERVYDNHSHWLTAHLPKLVLLRDRGMLGHVLLPAKLTPVMETSLRRLGLKAEQFSTFEPDRPIEVERLTLLSTDRFRPDLLRPVRQAIGEDAKPATRRVFVSRAKAPRRRLIDEDQLWPLLEARGFEKVFLEDLSFDEQVALMGETRVLFAPHGAGLTNMMFCPEGTRIVEIADLTFPNPNFYALAAAMGHDYWLLPGVGQGDVHPLEKDIAIDSEQVRTVLDQLDEEPPTSP